MADNEALKELKSKRASNIKGKLTKFTNFKNDPSNHSKKTQIRVRLTDLEPLLNEFEKLSDQIDAITKVASSEYDDVEKLYCEIISKGHDLIETRSNEPTPQPMNLVANSHDNPLLRIRKMELPTFNGAFDKWLSFYNQFHAMVHLNSGLVANQKLYYLKDCLKDEAEDIISSFELTEANYEVALELLKAPYDNKRLIIQKHVHALMDLPIVGKESASDLRKFIDSVNSH